MEFFEVKAAFEVDAAGGITGLAAVFGTADMGGDIIHKGAFAGVTGPIPMLASHDQADVVGVWDELVETAQGLMVKGRLLVADVVRAAEVRALIIAGAMSGLSIGYVATAKKARVGGGRDLMKITLHEVSIVAVPMHPDAKITAVKALRGGKVDDLDPEEVKRIELEKKAAADAIAAAVAAAVAPYVQRLDKIEAKGNRPGGDDDVKADTIEQKAFQSYLQNGQNMPEAEKKALMVSSDPMGGYLAPPELSSEIIKDLRELSPLRQYASMRGTSAPSVRYITRKLMGNATWHGEVLPTGVAETTGQPFGGTEVFMKGISTYVDVSNQLLADAPEVSAELREALSEDFAIKETIGFIKGTGIMDVDGLLVDPTIVSFNGGNAAAFNNASADVLIKMIYSLPQTYRAKGVFMMNGVTIGVLRTLKDGQGRYLWQDPMAAGQPDRLYGYPVIEMPDMDDIGAGKEPILFGDPTGYRIVDRSSLSILVDPFSRALFQETRLHATKRVGARVLMGAKFRKLKIAV